jgi:hypothetical protein
MALLNPSNAALTTLTFTTVGTGTTTDALGNTVRNQATVTVEAIVTPRCNLKASAIFRSR